MPTCISQTGARSNCAPRSACRAPRCIGFSRASAASPSTFGCAGCGARTGCWRIGAARVSEIATACGFTNDAHFSRAFRQCYGYTAREAMLPGRLGTLVRSHEKTPGPEEEAVLVDWIQSLRG